MKPILVGYAEESSRTRLLASGVKMVHITEGGQYIVHGDPCVGRLVAGEVEGIKEA